MVNMFGASNAFGLRYARRTYNMPTQIRMAPQPTGNLFGGNCCGSGTTNITINNGPSGFWGFMGGLFNGLTGGGLFGGMGMGGLFGGMGMGGLFGGMGMGGLFGGMGMGYPALSGGLGGLTGCSGLFGAQNSGNTNQAQSAQQKLANLNKLYPGYNIVLEDGDKFTATKTDKDGKTTEVGSKLSYEDMLGALKAANGGEPQGTGGADLSDKSKTATEKEDQSKETGTIDGQKRTDTEEQTTKDSSSSSNSGSSAGSSSGTRGASRGGSRTINGVKQNLNGWYRASKGGEKAAIDKLVAAKKDKTTAEDVVNTILRGKMDYLSKKDREDLVNLMIANNPSVFGKNGNVTDSPDWSKLDIPSIASLKNRYVKGGTKYDKKTGTVTYTNNNGEKVSGKSTIGDSNRHIIRGKNGYWVDLSGPKPQYHAPNGDPIDRSAFNKMCPNIGKGVDKKYGIQTQANLPAHRGEIE